MFRKVTAVAIAATFALSLCACGGGENNQPAADGSSVSSSVEKEGGQEQEYDPSVENINLTLEGGSIRFDHVEKANEGLTDNENAWVFVFDFTNEQSAPSQVQSVFSLSFFQNGVEIDSNLAYSSDGGDQYDLIGAFFDNAMKGGTVMFGRLVEAKDDSPITVMVSPNGAPLEDNYQTMEVPISDSGSSSESSDEGAAAQQGGQDTQAGQKAEAPKSEALNIGDTASNDQFTVTLTDARVDTVLSSSESSTYWEPDEGTAFVILEFDVTALTSDELPVDDYAITDLVANYNGDTYKNWTLQYVNSQLWLYFRHTYLDANMPCHVYAYTFVPADALESGDLSVSLSAAGSPYTVTIR